MPEEPTATTIAAPPPDDIADLMADDEPVTPAEGEPAAAYGEPAGDATQTPAEGEPCGEDGTPCSDPTTTRALYDWVKQEFGDDMARYMEKYGNDREAMQGLLNAAKLVGARDMDAQIGKALRGRLGDDEITKIIRGEKPQPAAEPEKKDTPTVDFDEKWLYQVQVDPQSGELVPIAGASKDIPGKVKAYFEHREKFLNDFVRDPAAVVDKILQGRLQQLEQSVSTKAQQATVAQQQESAVQGWVAQNAKVLWVDGDPQKGNTAIGDEFFTAATELAESGVTDPVQQLRMALKIVNGNGRRPAANPTKPASPRAQHAGGGSKPGKKFASAEDMAEHYIDQGVDFDEAFRRARREFKR
jgi:hypothetical protein